MPLINYKVIYDINEAAILSSFAGCLLVALYFCFSAETKSEPKFTRRKMLHRRTFNSLILKSNRNLLDYLFFTFFWEGGACLSDYSTTFTECKNQPDTAEMSRCKLT